MGGALLWGHGTQRQGGISKRHNTAAAAPRAARALSATPSPVPYAHPHTARSFGLLLSKGARSRYGEDGVVSRLVIKAVAEAMGVPTQVRRGCAAGSLQRRGCLPAGEL